MQARPWVAVHRVGGEVLELGQGLETGVAAADEDVGEHLLPARRVLGRVRHLQGLDDVVSEPDRVGEALEADCVLVEARHREGPGNRADREHQLVVAQVLGLAIVHPRLDRAGGGVVGGDRAQPEVGALEDLPQRGDHVARLQQPGRRLGQERRVEDEIDVVDEHQPRRLLRQQVLQLPGTVGAREATTGDHHVPGHVPSMTGRGKPGDVVIGPLVDQAAARRSVSLAKGVGTICVFGDRAVSILA